MISTKDQILQLADELILNKGFNAFSFADISERLGIKKASVHYHFASKEQLGVSLVKYHTDKTKLLFDQKSDLSAIGRLLTFFEIYEQRHQLSQVCLVGSLGTDFYTIPDSMQAELKELSNVILNGLTDILIDGKRENTFRFADQPRTKALMIITNLLGGLQLSRLTGTDDFETIKRSILDNLLYKQ
ncbi:MAG: TetR family transcriptional regulator [Flammeovirgaceae bacterium]|nr:TetR family transcriptional regulator [Flammeovirgaceae bacterium]MBR06628.1 TetR family transcriptional regulator [Rickettsiales bacterium]HCX24098.1 TetR/AcrR family transcriptional regulator [Cytophagales bacterium]|tara:strand:- start:65 stop:625 length:561 start_codon:yes stop_codon:yes gene_type:complete